MAKLENVFSWSHSRRNTFNDCKRRYYYHYYGSWGGWERDAGERQRELYLHKNLVNRWIWSGKVVHEAIERILKESREGNSLQDFEFYQDAITERMRSDFLDSKNQKYHARPNRILGLTEHHYEEELEGEEWKRLHQNTLECLKVFWDSELYGQLKETPPENVLEIEDLTHFLIGDLKVWVSLDYCRSHQDLVHIYDWKTGRSEKEATAEQLACYALYAKETWGVEVEKVQLVEFNLAKNKVIDYPIKEVDLIEVQSEILDSALSMQSLLFDKPGNMAREEDFSPTDDEETCRRCSFRGVCSDSLS